MQVRTERKIADHSGDDCRFNLLRFGKSACEKLSQYIPKVHAAAQISCGFDLLVHLLSPYPVAGYCDTCNDTALTARPYLP
jgi:hypothetical protein